MPLLETGSSSEKPSLSPGLSSCIGGQNWATCPVPNHTEGWDDSWTTQAHLGAKAGWWRRGHLNEMEVMLGRKKGKMGAK